MKLDPTLLRFLNEEDFRVLTAVELGMRNHELVPTPLIERVSNLRCGGAKKRLSNCLKYKLVWHETQQYDGYRLTYLGYDFLALHTYLKRNRVTAVGNKLGVGKEADIFLVTDEDGRDLVLKLHRLGRTSFQKVTEKRDYTRRKGKRGGTSWMYLSRLAAMKEFAFMKALHEEKFPVPEPIDQNRHTILMTRVPGYTLTSIRKMSNPMGAYETCLDLIAKMASFGLIHGDFNEYNIMVDDDENVVMIDFPQMTSTEHANAQVFLDRDIQGVHEYFVKKFNIKINYTPKLGEAPELKKVGDLDGRLHASGWTGTMESELERLTSQQKEQEELSDDDSITSSFSSTDPEDGEEEEEEEDEESEEEVNPEGPPPAGKPTGEEGAGGEGEAAPKPASAPRGGYSAEAEEGGGSDEEPTPSEAPSACPSQIVSEKFGSLSEDFVKARIKAKIKSQGNREFNRKLARGRNMQKGREKVRREREIKGTILAAKVDKC